MKDWLMLADSATQGHSARDPAGFGGAKSRAGQVPVFIHVCTKRIRTISAVAVLLGLSLPETAQPQQIQVLKGHRPAAAISGVPVGQLEEARELRLAIGLPLRDKEGLTNLLQNLYDPSAPEYHHFLTPAEFAARFGPTPEDYKEATAFAIAHQLKIEGTFSNRTLLDISGPVSSIEKAFHVKLRTYNDPHENRLFYAPDTEPSVEMTARVLHVSGLDNYVVPHPMSLTRETTTRFGGMVSASGSGPAGTYIGADFRAAYAPGVTLTGAGQSVGLLEFDGYFPSDISAYASMAKITPVPVTNVYLDGFGGTPGRNNTEVSLDIDMANCVAPGLASIIVYEGTVPNDILNQMAADGLAHQLSSSWSYPIDATTEQIFQQFAAQGQSFFNASDDQDAWFGDVPTPCDDPNVTIVGGTTLTTRGPGGAYLSETVWNWGTEFGLRYNGEGSGGGVSATYPIPSWQTNVSMAANGGSTSYRNGPDVALTADNIFIVADGGEELTVGGTSCATALWAAFIALANEQAADKKLAPVGFVNPAIYQLGLSADYANCFHDITNGNNTWSVSQSRYYAAPGYDLCTGWGTPMGSNLIDVLAPPDALRISPIGGWIPSGKAGGPLTPGSQSYTLTNTGSATLDWAAGINEPWLKLSLDHGTLDSRSSATFTASLNAAASNLTVGVRSATIWVTNVTDGAVQERTCVLSVISAPIISTQPSSVSLIEGSTAAFNAIAIGSSPLISQWQCNGVPLTNGGRVSISQSPLTNQTGKLDVVSCGLTISNVGTVDEGTYSLIASNPAGTTVSSNALLVIKPSGPVITQQPITQTAFVGSTVQFAVAAIGSTPLTYQWQQNGANLTDGGGVSGSGSPVLTINNASSGDMGTYTALISNALGTAVSAEAVLTVEVPLPNQQLVQNDGFETGDFTSWVEAGDSVDCTVTNSPFVVYSGNFGALLTSDSIAYLSQTLPVGAPGLYALSLWLDSPDGVSPNEFVVQWNGNVLFNQTNLGAIGWTNLQFLVAGDGTNALLQFGFLNEDSAFGLDDVQVVPLASAGGAPIIATEPSSQAVGQGGSASFNVLSSGQLPLFYQWQFNGADLDSATNSNLTLLDLGTNQSGIYSVVVSNSVGWTISANALLTVLTGNSNIITFDDLPDSVFPVPSSYDNLTWSNFDYLDALADGQGSGYSVGVVSVPRVAFNNYGAPATISAAEPFALLSAYLTAAWNDDLQLEVQGYNGSSLKYDNTWHLSATAPTLIAFNYVDVTSVIFISSDGITHPGYNGSGTHFVMDNVSVVMQSVEPTNQSPIATTLHTFEGFDGGSSSAPLTQGPDGNYYGVTKYGGRNNYGTVFRMTTNGVLATLLSFDDSNGAYPGGGLALGADGKLYGTTEYGGTNDAGTVFSITTNGALSTLASFNYNVTGGYPSVSLLQATDGNFYGTTETGGTYSYGTIFKFIPGGALTALVSFDYNNGANPQAGLTQGTDGSLYGTTVHGGAEAQQGTIFKVTTNGVLTVVSSFNYLIGGLPSGGLVQASDGSFYGTTVIGGTNDYGTVFRMTAAGQVSTVASFDYNVLGGYPTTTLTLGVDGNIYGTTPSGGLYSGGTVFEMTTNGVLSNLYSFRGIDGAQPNASLVQGPDGSFYGTTLYGGAGFNGAPTSSDGVIFRLGGDPSVGLPVIIGQPAGQSAPLGGAATFNVNAGGSSPMSYMWERNGSPIAGATQSSYTVTNLELADSGSQFRCVIANSAGSVTSSNATLAVFTMSGPLYSFSGSDGGWPFGALVQAPDGNFYGTTEYGGANGVGSVFKMSGPGSVTTLASFSYYVTGGQPWGGLVFGADGNLYGTASFGGGKEMGTIFRVTTNGTLTNLLSFSGANGSEPYDSLVLGTDGRFYGTTFEGGAFGEGTVFSISTNGIFSNLASTLGYPYAGLVLGTDGNFYGTTIAGGSGSYGSVFRVTAAGALTTLASFSNSNGYYPYGTLVQGPDGSFYGTTEYGGTYNDGTIFKVTTNGTLTDLVSFNGLNGSYPLAGLTLGSDGNFYGSTTQGGPGGDGTMFSLTTNGILTTLYSFSGGNGSYASSSLVQGADGSFYGATAYGGTIFDGIDSSGNGAIFRLSGPLTKQAPLIVTQPGNEMADIGTNLTLSVDVLGTGPLTYQWQFDGTNISSAITVGIIKTVAGDGLNLYSGDGGAATNASLSPSSVAVDAQGNLFMVDDDNARIRKVDTNGIISTVVGNGTNGFSGDGGAATNASLNSPSAVAVDLWGNIFVADAGNARIRRINANGIITTIAGSGTNGFSGDGDAATNASLFSPSGVAVDPWGNIFIADLGNARIREVNTNGIITTIAGNGTNGFSGDGDAATNASLFSPSGVAVDPWGNIFVADTGNERVRKIGTNGVITSVAGTGAAGYFGDGEAATNAGLNMPTGVAVDLWGNLFIADSQNNCIREVDSNGNMTTLAGNGTAGYAGDGGLAAQAVLNNPTAAGTDISGNVFVADYGNNRVREIVSQSPGLLIAGANFADAGSYDVIVSNVFGVVTSSVATLSLGFAPAIVIPPADLTLLYGDTATFAVTASGTEPLFLQWSVNGVDLNDGPLTSGAQSNILTLTGVTLEDSGTYEVLVTSPYGSAQASVTLRVQEPPILAWANPDSLVYGSPLTTNQLDAVANVPGTFSYSPTNGTVLDVGTNDLTVAFTPADAVDYTTMTASVNLVVTPAPLTVTASNITLPYGQSLPPFSGTIEGVTNEDNIGAVYTSTGVNGSPVGVYPIVPSLVDPQDRETNYSVTLLNGTLTITIVTPTVTWTNPVSIVYGTALTTNQLNATAGVPGTLTYLPTNGTVLDVGTNELTVMFTPADEVDYNTVIQNVSLVVTPAPLTVTASNISQPYGQSVPVFTGTIEGVTNGDNITATYSCAATNGSPVGIYPIVATLMDPQDRQTNYSVTLINGTFTITGAPVLSWTPAPITYGQAIGSNQLNATTSVPGSFAYLPTNGAFLNAGVDTLSLVFTPSDTTDFSVVDAKANLSVLPGTLTVTASNLTLPYGESIPPLGGTIEGVTNKDNITAAYTCAATNGSPVGIYPIVAGLIDPKDRHTNYDVTLVGGTLTITKVTPAVSWTNPASLIYGAPLTTNQLDATASIPGSFAYSPTNGTVLDVGTNELTVTYKPADKVDYSVVTASVSVIVTPAPLTVTASNVSQPYGQGIPFFTGTIEGVTNEDNISATYTCAATNGSPVGIYPIVPSLVDPQNRETNYSVTLVNGFFTMTGAPVVSWAPATITYGEAIGSNQLNATTSVPGGFAYLPTNGTVLNAGTNTLSVIFTPGDITDFTVVAGSADLLVLPAPLTATASNITVPYGQNIPPLTGTIEGITNEDNITVAYSCIATNGSSVGIYPIVPSLMDPQDRQTNYDVTLVNGTLTITEVTPAVAWTNPASIVYGAPLTTNQLNAVANVQGTFAYLETNGTVLDTGTNELTVVFTPADAVDYSIAIQNVSLVVTPAPLTVTASNVTQPYGQSVPLSLTGTVEGVTNGDNITVTYSCAATNGSAAGIYPIVPTLVDPQDRQTNYNVTLIDGTLVITGTPVLSWFPAPLTYGQPLGSNQLNAVTGAPGSFAYIPTNGTVLNAGTNTLSVVFTPNDTGDFGGVAGNVDLLVLPAPLTVTASNMGRTYGLTNPPFTGMITGVTNGDNITAAFSCDATNGSPVGIYPIMSSLVDPQDRQTNYDVTLVNGTLSIVSPPIIQGASQSGSSLTFTWSAGSNQMYQIQYTTNLAQPWVVIGNPIVSTNSTMTVSESIGSNSQQFYRIVPLQ